MGATTFTEFWEGTSAEKAFRKAVDESKHEYGHGGYTGTIAEKGDFTIITRDVMSLPAAEALASKMFNEDDPRINDKWGPAGAIPVFTGRRRITVNVPEGTYQDWAWTGKDGEDPPKHINDLLKAQKVLRRGDKVQRVSLSSYTQVSHGGALRFKNGIAAVEIQNSSAPTQRKVKVSFFHTGSVTWQNTNEWADAAKAKVKLAPDEEIIHLYPTDVSPEYRFNTEANSKVKPETRYIVEGSMQHGTWETGFTSQALARKYAVDNIDRASDTALNVVGITKRSDGSPLVAVTREIKRTLTTVDVTILKTPTFSAPAQPDGWLFFGWASC